MKRLFRTGGFFISICLLVTFPTHSLNRELIHSGNTEVPDLLDFFSDAQSDEASSGVMLPDIPENAPSESTGMYGENTFVPCTTGLLTYYNQSDPRWADFLYGSTDPMSAYGCGPTALAMVVSSYTATPITPPEMAVWASDNGYCSSGEGSRHALIPEGLTHFGLAVTPMSDRSTEAVLEELRKGRIVVALMNKGYFTNGGHFLLLTQINEDGTIRIADPASWQNTTQSWDPAFILSQVRTRAEAGGPLWSVELPPET